jgi:hypothetical protein
MRYIPIAPIRCRPISIISRIKVTNTKILYLEFNCILTGIFALIGNHP